MRVAFVASIALALATIGCAPAPTPAPPEPPRDTPEQVIAAAAELDRRFVEAFNARDAEALAATYWKSPDAVSFPPDALMHVGWDAIRAGAAGTFAAMPPAKLELLDEHHVPLGDAAVASWGRWRITLTLPDGTTATQEGRFSDVKAKRDGAWVYLMDHASVPMTSGGAPPAPEGAAPPAASTPAGG